MWSLAVRRTLLAGGAAVVLGGSALGLALAQQPPPSPTVPGQTAPARPGFQAYIDALARRLGITSDRLQQLMGEARSEVGLDGAGHRGGGPGRRGGVGRAGGGLAAAA